MEIATTNIEERAAKVRALRDKLIDGILKIPYTRLNGDRERRLPGNVNVCLLYTSPAARSAVFSQHDSSSSLTPLFLIRRPARKKGSLPLQNHTQPLSSTRNPGLHRPLRKAEHRCDPVSYTHLDVYKRQSPG